MSMDHVVKVTKSHGHRICLGIGLLEDFKKALKWPYKGSRSKVAQMGLALKDEVEGM